MEKSIITEASWSGDEKSVNFTTYDADKGIGVKENKKRHTVDVGNDNWENENEDNCKIIINDYLNNLGLISENDFSIE